MAAIDDLNAATARNTASIAALVTAVQALPNQDAAIEAAVTTINAASDAADAETAILNPPAPKPQ